MTRASATVRLFKWDLHGITIEVALDLEAATAYNAAGEAVVKADDGMTLLTLFQSWGYRSGISDLSSAA